MSLAGRETGQTFAAPGVGVGVRALVGGDARGDVTDVDLQFLGEWFLDEGDLVEGADRARVVEQPEQGVLALVAPVGVEVVRQLPAGGPRRAGAADRGVRTRGGAGGKDDDVALGRDRRNRHRAVERHEIGA